MNERVMVYDGAGKGDGRPGRYAGNVTLYAIVAEDGSLLSNKLSETKPDAELVASVNGELLELPENPKLILDSGEVVYGYQVWWKYEKGTDETIPL